MTSAVIMSKSLGTTCALLFPSKGPSIVQQEGRWFVDLALVQARREKHETVLLHRTGYSDEFADLCRAGHMGSAVIITALELRTGDVCLVFVNFALSRLEIVFPLCQAHDTNCAHKDFLTHVRRCRLPQDLLSRIVNLQPVFASSIEPIFDDGNVFLKRIKPHLPSALWCAWLAQDRARHAATVPVEVWARQFGADKCIGASVLYARLLQGCVALFGNAKFHTKFPDFVMTEMTTGNRLSVGASASIHECYVRPEQGMEMATLYSHFVIDAEALPRTLHAARTTTTAVVIAGGTFPYFAYAWHNQRNAVLWCDGAGWHSLDKWAVTATASPLFKKLPKGKRPKDVVGCTVFDDAMTPIALGYMHVCKSNDVCLQDYGHAHAHVAQAVAFSAILHAHAHFLPAPDHFPTHVTLRTNISYVPIVQLALVRGNRYVPLTPTYYELRNTTAIVTTPEFFANHSLLDMATYVVVSNNTETLLHPKRHVIKDLPSNYFSWSTDDGSNQCVVSYDNTRHAYVLERVEESDERIVHVFRLFLEYAQPAAIALDVSKVPQNSAWVRAWHRDPCGFKNVLVSPDAGATDTSTLYIVSATAFVTVVGHRMCRDDVVNAPKHWRVRGDQQYNVFSHSGAFLGRCCVHKGNSELQTQLRVDNNDRIVNLVIAAIKKYDPHVAAVVVNTNKYKGFYLRLHASTFAWLRAWGETQIIEVSTPTTLQHFKVNGHAKEVFGLERVCWPVASADMLPQTHGVFVRLFGVSNGHAAVLGRLYTVENRITQWKMSTAVGLDVFAAALLYALLVVHDTDDHVLAPGSAKHVELAAAAGHAFPGVIIAGQALIELVITN